MNQTLILILGLPGSGKTTLSKKLAEELKLPLISRDDIKLLIMDNLRWADREWSKKVGKASYEILNYVIREQIKSRASFIIESDFRRELTNDNFSRMQNEFGFNSVQIICHANSETLIKRWQERAMSDLNHPSNTEGEAGLQDLHDAIKLGERQPLDIEGSVIRIDTNDFTSINELAIAQQIRELL